MATDTSISVMLCIVHKGDGLVFKKEKKKFKMWRALQNCKAKLQAFAAVIRVFTLLAIGKGD